MNFFPARSRALGWALVAAILVLPSTSIAQLADSVGYTVALSSPEQHLVEVQIILPPGAEQRELQLPVWNALYQIRDFAQYVNWIRAKDRSGAPLVVARNQQESLADFGCGERRDCGLSNLCRFPRTI